MTHSHLLLVRPIAAGLVLLLSAGVHAQDADELARNLVELRSAVETLNQELDLLRQEHRAEMNALAAQKAELEANRSRVQTQIGQLEQQLATRREEAAAAGVDNEQLLPVVTQAIDELASHIQQSIPFKRDERLAELDEFRLQLASGVVPANRAANRLWAFYEDEIRLTRENGIYSQTLELNGDRILADVARLGTVMMFFRTQDQRYGEAVVRNGSWTFEPVEGAEEIAVIDDLFDSLAKQIRQGYFQLPNTFQGRTR